MDIKNRPLRARKEADKTVVMSFSVLPAHRDFLKNHPDGQTVALRQLVQDAIDDYSRKEH